MTKKEKTQEEKAQKNLEKEFKTNIKELKKAISKATKEEEKQAMDVAIKSLTSLVDCKDVDLKTKAFDSICRMEFAKMELFYLNGIYNLFLSGIIPLEQFVTQTDHWTDKQAYVEKVTKAYKDLSNAGVIK